MDPASTKKTFLICNVTPLSQCNFSNTNYIKGSLKNEKIVFISMQRSILLIFAHMNIPIGTLGS